MFRTIVRNLSANYIGVAGQIVVAFLLTPFVIKTLGDELYGVWTIIAALGAYLTLCDVGVVSAVTKYISHGDMLKHKGHVSRVISCAFVIVIPIAIVLLLLSPLTGRWLVDFVNVDPEHHKLIILAAMLTTIEVAIFVFAGPYRGVIYGMQRIDIENLIQLSVLALRAIGIYLVLSYGLGIVGMASVMLTAMLTASLATYAFSRKLRPNTRPSLSKVDREGVATIRAFSGASFLSMVAGQLIFYSDSFVIGHFLTASAVAYYAIAWTLKEYTNQLMAATHRVFIPVFSNLSTGGNEVLVDHFFKASRYMLVISNLLCFGLLVLGDRFLAVWLGEKYSLTSGNILMILCIAQLIRGPQFLSYALLQGIGGHKVYARLELVFAFANLVLSIILVQWMGLIGVALATAATQLVFYGLVSPYLVTNALSISLWLYIRETFGKTVLPAVILAIALFVLKQLYDIDNFLELFLVASVGTVPYLATVYFFTLSADERSVLLQKVTSRFTNSPQEPANSTPEQ